MTVNETRSTSSRPPTSTETACTCNMSRPAYAGGVSIRRAAPVLCGCAGVAAAVFVTLNDPAAPGSHYPQCVFRTSTGLWCPGCGLTRGFHQLFSGHLLQALNENLFVPVALTFLLAPSALAQDMKMGFFVTSVGSGKGADLGGLDGADKHCQTLAEAAGSTGQTWRAYLSTQGDGAVNARDRIGAGPWANAKGEVIAKDVAELHGANNLTKATALSEKGEVVNGRGDTPNMHDILTGTQADGTAFAVGEDRTCGNWTLS